jgi:hypothetical protein
VCRGRPGIEDVAVSATAGVVFRATDEAAVGELSRALTDADALVLELSPNRATLEDLFFALTEGDGANGAGPGAGRRDAVAEHAA